MLWQFIPTIKNNNMNETLRSKIKEAILNHCVGVSHCEFNYEDLDEIINDIANIDEMKKLKEDAEQKTLHKADDMHSFYQQIAKEHNVHADRIMLAITDNGKYFQAYVTNEAETELRYLQDYVINKTL